MVRTTVDPAFEGGFGARRRYGLGVLVDRPEAPFRNCAEPAESSGWFGAVINGALARGKSLQARALRRPPTIRRIYARRRSQVAGSTTVRDGTAVYRLAMTITLVRAPARRFRR